MVMWWGRDAGEGLLRRAVGEARLPQYRAREGRLWGGELREQAEGGDLGGLGILCGLLFLWLLLSWPLLLRLCFVLST